MRVLLTTVPLPGHFFPLAPLGWAFRLAGHEVLVATSEEFCSTVQSSGLPTVSCGPAAGYAELAAGHPEALGPAEWRYANGTVFGRIAAHCLPGMMALVRSWQPDLIISERAEFAGPIAAAAHQVPQVELHWGIAPLVEHREGATEVLAGRLAQLGMEALPQAGWVLHTWPPSLRQTHAAGQLSLRYVPYNGVARVQDWLLAPRDKARICLTLGTVIPQLDSRGMFDTVSSLAAELMAEEVELLVAVDDKVATDWPPLPPSVRTAGWLPMAQVLQACDLSVHHGGNSTALTGLRAGCPQLLLPQFDDQVDNAAAIAGAGAGLALAHDEITPQAAAQRCLELLGSPRFAEAARATAAEMAEQPSPSQVVGALENLIS
uniref:nucleotide disphospho-sugar-binding domain-containing protein n=1 Tax=Nocardia suismassiliense TaxID=2077092 RepID=UPI003F49565F